jgi:hypothetical protein
MIDILLSVFLETSLQLGHSCAPFTNYNNARSGHVAPHTMRHLSCLALFCTTYPYRKNIRESASNINPPKTTNPNRAKEGSNWVSREAKEDMRALSYRARQEILVI